MKQTFFALVAVALIISAALFLSRGAPAKTGDVPAVAAAAGSNVSVVDGKQIVEIAVKGGYTPGNTVAKAGIPTVIRFKTNGTFDCSSSVRIPSLSVSQKLPQTGSTDIDVGTPAAGQLAGTCSMGMYKFDVDFQA